ncbi:hypothetical protein L6452_40373 [Arctium lappa]|uniref:Uncharacterized protein n=1 Tax=Arctium lappa TaxID=4217 RepID=A0ACB8XM42_ARCLA|nr:hypothetical protein L6452_40373 [Arctium lappa]
MGSTESTGRSNQTSEDEDEGSQPENGSSGGGSGGAGKAIAIVAAGTVMAWGISKMISGSKDSESKEKDDAMKIKAHEMGSSLSNFPINYESIQYEAMGKGPTCIWSPPPRGRFKMNTDGVCYGTKLYDGTVEQGKSGYAGILRNDRGEWVRGFQGFIDLTDSFTAELNGIYYGIKLLDKPEYKGSILETDHRGAFESLNKSEGCKDKHPIIEESKLLARKYNITIEYVPRGANRCADKLANMAVDKLEEYLELKDCPQDPEFLSRYYQDLKSCK